MASRANATSKARTIGALRKKHPPLVAQRLPVGVIRVVGVVVVPATVAAEVEMRLVAVVVRGVHYPLARVPLWHLVGIGVGGHHDELCIASVPYRAQRFLGVRLPRLLG